MASDASLPVRGHETNGLTEVFRSDRWRASEMLLSLAPTEAPIAVYKNQGVRATGAISLL